MDRFIRGDIAVAEADASAENARLRREITRIKSQIRTNERVWSGFRYVEISAIGADSLHGLLDVLSQGFLQTFPNIDCVTVACFDLDFEMVRLLENNNIDVDKLESFVHITPEALNELFSNFSKPMLGRCDDTMQQLLFPHCKQALGSVAIAPLILQDRLIGCLNQGSVDPVHFTPGTQTDFLEHLSAVAAVCIDNAVNHERMKEDGLTDPLTGLANRRFFEKRLHEEVQRWARHGINLSCIMVDIDHFKQVNDSYGHQHGDYVLKEVANTLGSELRASDVLARYGGEEFVLLFPDTTLKKAIEIADRLRERVADLKFEKIPDNNIQVTISLGVADLDSDIKLGYDEACVWLVHQTDTALYNAKHSGRNRVIVATNQRQLSRE